MSHMHSKHGSRQRAHHLMVRTGYKSGGAVKHADETEDKALIKKEVEHAKIKLKEGGTVEGRATGGRLDKLARGGKHGKHHKGKPHVTVNVMNHPSAPPPTLPPIGLGAGPHPPMATPPVPPGGPMLPPPGAGSPPGLGMKTGGRMSKRAEGGSMGAPTQGYSTKKIPEPSEEKHLKTGGRLGGKAAPHMTGGAGSGVGREEKAEYQAKYEKPKAK